MVIIWGGNWGGGRRRRPGWGRPGWGRGYGGYGPPPGYGRYRRRSGGDGSCLRDLLLLNTGCCLANAIGCGAEMLLVAPTTARQVRAAGRGSGGRVADRLIAAVRVYQREVSPRRPPCCSFTPTCSAYAVQALETHGARRGSWLTLRRLARCHPRAAGGIDQVPAAA